MREPCNWIQVFLRTFAMRIFQPNFNVAQQLGS